MARVGIFFLVEGSWLIDAVPVHEGERYGDAVGHGGHYDYWAALRPRTAAERRFAGHDYDFFPRGRVVCFAAARTFRVYVDNCLTEAQRADLAAQFGLTAQAVVFEGNEDGTHYICGRSDHFVHVMPARPAEPENC